MEIRYPDLPVVEHRAALLDAIGAHQVVVVAGETGSGKSTQLPKLCLELGLGEAGWIGHTQPRRIAARAVAERVAEELGVEVGGLVGSKVRFNDKVGEHTQVKVMTDGVLLAEVAQDRRLTKYSTIIVDEAHERSLNIDFLLGFLRRLLPDRPDLKVIITSATIDTARFAEHFAGAPVIEVSGRSYPVEVRYRPIGEEADDDRDQVAGILDAVDELGRDQPGGDVLVFLSGERDIRDTADALVRRNLPHTEILPLYARLSSAEQHRVFSPHPGRRIVLATNVAETSLTVPGIVGVIDTGTARISRYNRRSKVQRLPIEDISQASADQRAGRCGRVAPGTCIRLYSEEDYDGRPRFTEPEILRTNLASVILQLAALGMGEVEAFPFVDPPDARSIKDGLLLLEELGALRSSDDGHVRLTKLGRRLARLPVDPRLGRMVLEADRHGCVSEVLVIAAALSIQDPRERPREKEQRAAELHGRFAVGDSDFLSYLELWRYVRQQQKALSSNQFRRLCKDELLHHLRIREWQDLHAQLRQVTLGLGIDVRPLATEADADGIHRSLLAGLLSHIGHWDEEKREYRGARETRFTIAGGSALGKRRPKWVVAAELVETDRLRARTVASISPDRIEQAAAHLVTHSYGEPWWDRERGAAMVEERVSLYGLPIVPKRRINVARVNPGVAREIFLRHALVRGEWEAPHGFLATNHERLVEVAALEHRLRRDLIVSEDQLVDFFSARVPDDVTDARRFDRWWKGERARRSELLDYTVDVLTGGVDPGDADAAFPEWVRVHGVDLPLTYTAAPGADLDGVAVDVPLLLLDRVHEARLDWQVPGLRGELIEAIVRALPKDLRRELGPAPEAVAALREGTDPGDGPLVDVLARAIGRLVGHPVALTPAVLAAVPEHLRVTYRAVDDTGRPIAWSRDLPALRRRMQARLQAALAERSPLPEASGLRTWPADGVPRQVVVRHAGTDVPAYPALVDEGETVARRVFATPGEQASAMWAGTRRLLLLEVGSPLRAIDRALTTATKLDLARTERFRAAEVYLACAEAAVDHLLLAAGGPVWEADAYVALADQVRKRFAEVAAGAATTVGGIAATLAAIDERLSTMVSSSLDETVVDVEAHLGRLLGRGWITTAGVDGLADVARYLKAEEHRLGKAMSEPGRDAARLRTIRDLERAYAPVAHLDALGEVRRQLEELRVATFAQSVGAKGGSSEQKVRRALAGLGAL